MKRNTAFWIAMAVGMTSFILAMAFGAPVFAWALGLLAGVVNTILNYSTHPDIQVVRRRRPY